MPVNYNLPREGMLYQRSQYRNSFLTRFFWNLRDEAVIENIADGGTILDLGCGEGLTLERIAGRLEGKNILGLDLCRENIEICARLKLRVVHGDVTKLPFRDASIDCCLFLEVIEHLAQPRRALAEIYRTLKKDGSLLIIFPNDFVCRAARLATLKIREAFYDTGHLRQWTPADIKKELPRHGFAVKKQFSIPFNIWSAAISHLVVASKI